MKSIKPKQTRRAAEPSPAARPAKHSAAWVVVLSAAVLLVTLAAWRKPPAPAANEPAHAPGPSNESSNAAAATPATSDFQKLRGKWLRPDGGYVIEIKAAAAEGRLDASYFNPRSIHVAQAQARAEGGTLKVFLELRDVNYPGSTYALTYVPQRDLLAGVYYQAVEKRSYEVYFERMP